MEESHVRQYSQVQSSSQRSKIHLYILFRDEWEIKRLPLCIPRIFIFFRASSVARFFAISCPPPLPRDEQEGKAGGCGLCHVAEFYPNFLNLIL